MGVLYRNRANAVNVYYKGNVLQRECIRLICMLCAGWSNSGSLHAGGAENWGAAQPMSWTPQQVQSSAKGEPLVLHFLLEGRRGWIVMSLEGGINASKRTMPAYTQAKQRQ